MLVYKLHEHSDVLLLGIADLDVLGKTYEDKNGYLDLITYADYYQGEEATLEQLENVIKNLKSQSKYSINAVGKNSVKLIKKHFQCGERTIQKIPHVQVYKI